MNADTAKRIAAERLPCICNYKHLPGTALHTEDCPAHYRPAISSALLEAAKMPTLEMVTDEMLYTAARSIHDKNLHVFFSADFPHTKHNLTLLKMRLRWAALKELIIAAWSKPQETGT